MFSTLLIPPKSFLGIIAIITIIIFTLTAGSSASRRQNCKSIDASFSLSDGSRYFLSGNEYMTYNMGLKSEGQRGRIHRGMRGVRSTNIDAAFTYVDGTLFLLKGDQYYRYNVSAENRTFELLTTDTLSNLGLPVNVDAALTWGQDILAFHGCTIYILDPLTGLFTQNVNLTSRGLPCDLDAALEWENGGALFIKRAQVWLHRNGELNGPLHVDFLNICSWFLCGEADWIFERRRHRGRIECNGDKRLCDLRLDQVTLAGLHNAGAGFAGGFGSLLNCWARNHAQNITKQLQDGIRHLDIDPCWDTCGLLGTCHSFFCGGAICPMIKQVRHFLRDNPHDVISLYFNHEVTEPEKVFPALTRMLKTQFTTRLLNRKFRQSGSRTWPTLKRSIRTGRRLFVFYPYHAERAPHKARFYDRNLWIHSGNSIGSTWRPFNMYWPSTCEGIVPLTQERCHVRRYRHLVEVSIIPAAGACVSSMAESCRLHLHESLSVCQGYRFRTGVSPNILLVDYPEEDKEDYHSVYSAVYHQNIRNIAKHRVGVCEVKINASVAIPGTETALLFVGKKLLVVDTTLRRQLEIRNAGPLSRVKAAFFNQTSMSIVAVAANGIFQIDPDSLDVTRAEGETLPAADDMIVLYNSNEDQPELFYYRGCSLQPASISTDTDTNRRNASFPAIPDPLPCDIDAAMISETTLTVFRGEYYWVYTNGVKVNEGYIIVDWAVDAVQCKDD